ncbi:efflux transporter outer membrane subunit [Novosphingobium capsulatum]|uniref:efflux transporter outer membrane subunit n=1 Tax=Novosphingobium capsulatum TaxID=13688 RepID=UPI0007877611|nr:efflux transporter outer membrane subunit [Novosphingobium capsulatum]WQD91312.1 efflux transporter outer membrane subunit [Novosphingobium capsulatum]
MRAPLSRFSALVIPGMALPLILAGCSMAPAYRPPATVAIPPQFKEEPGWAVATPSDAVARGAWWDLFGDPVLDSLEQKVAVTNQNVASYRAAYQAARALVQVQRSALFPSLTASASGTRSQDFAGQNVTGGTGVSTTTTGATVSRYSLSIGASWEPDLWGRLGNTVNQAKASAQASEGDLANATLSAQGELATNYVQLRGIDAQRVLLDRTVADYTRALAITTNKYKAGTVSHADVFEAQTTLSNAQATRADLDRQRAVLEHAIAVLVGENPSTFALPAVDWQPVVPEIPAQVPAALLQRRPDIAAAERRVAAANANVGIQKAAYFPQVTLSSSVGTNSSVIGQLFQAATSLWSLGLSGAMTLLDFGARHGAVVQARAQYDQTVATYRQTVLAAFQQVEDNLAGTRVLAQVAQRRAEATVSASQAETIANNQYRNGIVDYTSVITAQTAALSARQTEIQSVIDRQTAAIALAQAVGGRWSDQPPAPAAAAAPATGASAQE